MVLDPYLTECGERIRGFKRLSPMLIAPEELAVDYYVTSHLHFDHFDYDAIPIVAQCTKRTLFFGPASCQEKFIELGIQAHRCHRLDRGECYQDEKILIRAVMADHGTMAPDAIGLLVIGSIFPETRRFTRSCFRRSGSLSRILRCCLSMVHLAT